MQYGVELFPYERMKKLHNGKKEEKKSGIVFLLKLLVYFFSSMLVSRVIMIDFTAPFGIALLMAIISRREERKSIVVGCGVLAGYFTLYSDVKNFLLYIIITLTLSSTIFIIKYFSRTLMFVLLYNLVFIEYLIYLYFFNSYTLLLSVLLSVLQMCSIFVIFFILNYSINSFEGIRARHLFANEELISMAVTISLIISGTWGINVFGISVRNILALTAVFLISFINGSAIGSACGTAMGVIVGMSTKNMMVYISFYSLCGLIPGIFRDMGKWISTLSYIIISLILSAYSNGTADFKIMEVITAGIVFIMIPNNMYHNLILEFNSDKKQDHVNDEYINKIKNILNGRLNNFSEVLYTIVVILNKLVDNDKLDLKIKSSALVENLANNICSDCNMNSICWKRELHYTYNALAELIQNYQENRAVIPEEIDRKCIKRSSLIKNTEQIVNNHIINEMWKKRLSEGRELLSSQINNIAESVEEIISEFNSNIRFNHEMDKKIRRVLDGSFIKYEDIVCINDKYDRLKIKLSLKACGGRQLCIRQILPLINEAGGKTMCISNESCTIDKVKCNCYVDIEEVPKFHVSTYVERVCKEGENHNGDSFYYEKLKDGTYMAILSDGMGYGPQAGKESSAVIELIQKMTNSGFSKLTAINTVNSIMTLEFSEDEKFSTVDLSSIDLYTGDLEFMKVGAVSSFIKNGDNVQYIESKTLPIGILDKVDIEVTKKKVKNGDIIIMLSDGVLDSDKDNPAGVDWIKEYLKELQSPTPKDVAEGIIEKAKGFCSGRVKDDMTVVVSKIYSLF